VINGAGGHDLETSGRSIQKALVIAVTALAGLTYASWFFLAAGHVDDRYQTDGIAGVWMALAKYAHDGVFYPPLHQGGSFAGTRYMPLDVALHAALSHATGEYLLSGKLLLAGTSCALLITMFFLLRPVGCPRAVAAALPSIVLVTPTGLAATTRI
jgi:hypothetical protein